MIAFIAGLAAGSIHVWSGVDHLAAIAPLAARRPLDSLKSGAGWGLGHSIGVAIVGGLALLFRDRLPMEHISSWSERLVGLLLVGIGLWGFRQLARMRVHRHAHEHEGSPHEHLHVHLERSPHSARGGHRHTHAAVGIGVLHGLAGSSHFFGVLPALMLPSTAEAALYMGAYALGTVISMILFAGALGSFARWLGDRATRGLQVLMGACAAAAMITGCLWLAAR